MPHYMVHSPPNEEQYRTVRVMNITPGANYTPDPIRNFDLTTRSWVSFLFKQAIELGKVADKEVGGIPVAENHPDVDRRALRKLDCPAQARHFMLPMRLSS